MATEAIYASTGRASKAHRPSWGLPDAGAKRLLLFNMGLLQRSKKPLRIEGNHSSVLRWECICVIKLGELGIRSGLSAQRPEHSRKREEYDFLISATLGTLKYIWRVFNFELGGFGVLWTLRPAARVPTSTPANLPSTANL
jgi:hypothetical protein